VAVRLQPHASRDEIVEIRDGVLRVRVTAPALDGRANRALCRFIAKRLGVAPSSVSLTRGQRSRDKVLAVDGLEQADVDAVFGL
jgi:uncharacterized protein (TIGR00251 family)